MFYSNESFAISGLPSVFKGVFLESIVPANDEQKTLLGKMRRFITDTSEIKKVCQSDAPVSATEILKLAKEKQGVSTMLILGTVGNGKTTMASAMVNTWNDWHGGMNMGLYRTLDTLTDEYKDGFEYSLIKRYSEVGLLVVDELNPKSWSEYNKNLLQKIIVSRHASGKKTVLIGNLSGKQIREMFDDHILSRLREGASMVMTAPDMRQACDF